MLKSACSVLDPYDTQASGSQYRTKGDHDSAELNFLCCHAAVTSVTYAFSTLLVVGEDVEYTTAHDAYTRNPVHVCYSLLSFNSTPLTTLRTRPPRRTSPPSHLQRLSALCALVLGACRGIIDMAKRRSVSVGGNRLSHVPILAFDIGERTYHLDVCYITSHCLTEGISYEYVFFTRCPIFCF